MIVQNGSTPQERVGLGTIDTIEGVVEEAGLGSPAVIVVGDVVGKHPRLRDAYLSELLGEVGALEQ
jgi:uroporphyrin-III C-methyltransferase